MGANAYLPPSESWEPWPNDPLFLSHCTGASMHAYVTVPEVNCASDSCFTSWSVSLLALHMLMEEIFSVMILSVALLITGPYSRFFNKEKVLSSADV